MKITFIKSKESWLDSFFVLSTKIKTILKEKQHTDSHSFCGKKRICGHGGPVQLKLPVGSGGHRGPG